MAERLPVGAARNIKSPTPSLVSTPASSDIFNASSIDHRLNGQLMNQDPESNIPSNITMLSNGLVTASSHSSGHSRQSNSEASSRNVAKTKEGESHGENEWVEQDEPGVYITFTSLPGGAKDLKRVRFRYAYSKYVSIQELHPAGLYFKSNVGLLDNMLQLNSISYTFKFYLFMPLSSSSDWWWPSEQHTYKKGSWTKAVLSLICIGYEQSSIYSLDKRICVTRWFLPGFIFHSCSVSEMRHILASYWFIFSQMFPA